MIRIRIDDLPLGRSAHAVNADSMAIIRGGAGVDTKVQSQSGLRVQLQQTINKTTTGKSFSDIAASGLSKSADLAISAGTEGTVGSTGESLPLDD